MTSPIGVAIVDGDVKAALALSLCLSKEEGFDLVGVASNLSDAVNLVEQEQPQVILLDCHLCDGDGVAAFKGILSVYPDIRIVMLMGIAEHELLSRAFEGGCVGILSKDCARADVIAAVRSAAEGGLVMRSRHFAHMLGRLRTSPNQYLQWLSPHEQEVLELLAKEHSERSVASELMIPVSSVENHIRNALMKLGAKTKLEAVAFAIRDKLIVFQEA